MTEQIRNHKPCQCTVCRHNRGEITSQKALELSLAELSEIEKSIVAR